MRFFEQIGIDNTTALILIGGVLLTVVLIVLVFYIIHLRSKISNFDNPKYGFLGKTIYPIIGFAMLGTVLFIAGYGIISPETPDSHADYSVDGKLNAKVNSQTLQIVNTELSFTPYVSGKPWGAIDDSFDIFWKINGPIEVESYELGKTKFEPSSYKVSLPRGTYTVEITVVYKDKSFKFTDRVTY